jgi:hypothetical protein
MIVPPAVALSRPETAGGLGPDLSATRRADVYPQWSSQTKTGTLANQPGQFMQACWWDTLEPIGPRERLKPGESASFTEEWWLLSHPFPKKGQQLDLKALAEQVEKQTIRTK